jgi:hypothetical protein
MRKTFKENGAFGAVYEAEKWLKENGYSIGSMDSDAPIGVAKGEGRYISKWHNLGEDKVLLDGVIARGWKRDSDITIIIFDDVDPKGIYQ